MKYIHPLTKHIMESPETVSIEVTKDLSEVKISMMDMVERDDPKYEEAVRAYMLRRGYLPVGEVND